MPVVGVMLYKKVDLLSVDLPKFENRPNSNIMYHEYHYSHGIDEDED